MASNAPVNADDVSTIGQRWYVLFIMMLAYTISIADRYVLSTLLGPISKELNLSDIGAASLGIPLALFYVLMGIPLSWLCDRSNRRTLLVACVAVWSLMTALTGYTRGYYDLLLARIGVGFEQWEASQPVQPGDTVAKDQGLVTLESDKATMEVPASHAGVIKELKAQNGATVTSGQVLAILEEGAAATAAPAAAACAWSSGSRT